MKIAIVSGKAEGPTKLNAFDNALSGNSIGDVNLIKVSSMLGENTELEPLPKLKSRCDGWCFIRITSKNRE